MSSLQANEFEQFFLELHGRTALRWQKRLARLVCEQGWPKVIDLPTASGKTACIDIALFALAVRGKEAPRRIFFVVDRRVIVSEAFERADRIREKLKEAKGGLLKRVADQLRGLAGGDEPLCTYELRGGAFRDETWVETPLQPAVITSTVDQVGSRLLFRGYGIGEHTWPMHAGLIANDSILFLDEAHTAKAFAKTLEAVESYRGETWARDPLQRPFHFVEMTATPARDVKAGEHFAVEAEDREDAVLRSRVVAFKPTRLIEPVKCRKNETGKFAAALIEQAVALADEAGAGRVAILVNRIDTAKEVHKQLHKAQQNALLVIGRMRPLDRDSQAEELRPLKTGKPRNPELGRRFVVATQCLEVGADLDFDVLVSECASIDALQQRFGRLDRIGEFERARGAILAGSWQLSGKSGDPVYGDALRGTWEFLESVAADRVVNMGIASWDGGQPTVAEQAATLSADQRSKLMLQGESAPMLLPAHVDALAQTSPRPEPEPFIDYFLHGKRRGAPDVYVVWRSDINDSNEKHWAEIVSLCPPSSSEAMPVPLWAFRKWLAGAQTEDESDLETAAQNDEEESETPSGRQTLVWRGLEKSFVAKNPEAVPPGATVVLPGAGEGWDALGFKPKEYPVDRGDEARLSLRRRLCLRLHPSILNQWPECPNREELKELVSSTETEANEIWSALESYPSELRPQAFEESWKWLDKRTLSAYPAGEGWVVEGYYGEREFRGGKEVSLQDHLRHVEEKVEIVIGDLLPLALKEAVRIAAHFHDYGKADIRFQAWLRNGDLLAAQCARRTIAKSEKTILRKQTECGLPDGFRHELLSLMFAANSDDVRGDMRDLMLHLVASHHGRCRPFAPVAIDERAECVEFGGVSVCRAERVEHPPHALDSGVADRFWKLTRQYGWWGLAYLEAMLRLADWQASGEEKGEVME